MKLIIFFALIILLLFNRKKKEGFDNIKSIEKKTSNCLQKIKRSNLIKKDLEKIIFDYKICSSEDVKFKSIKPFDNDCLTSPYNKNWNTNLIVQKCGIKVDKKIIDLKKKFNLNKDEFNILKRWKNIKCLNNLPLKFSEDYIANNNNCENNCEFKKFKCETIINNLKNKVNFFKNCSNQENKSCTSPPSKFINNDLVEKNKQNQRCKMEVNNWLKNEYKYWNLEKDDRIRNFIDHWENLECHEDFFKNLDSNHCNLLTRCK